MVAVNGIGITNGSRQDGLKRWRGSVRCWCNRSLPISTTLPPPLQASALSGHPTTSVEGANDHNPQQQQQKHQQHEQQQQGPPPLAHTTNAMTSTPNTQATTNDGGGGGYPSYYLVPFVCLEAIIFIWLRFLVWSCSNWLSSLLLSDYLWLPMTLTTSIVPKVAQRKKKSRILCMFLVRFEDI